MHPDTTPPIWYPGHELLLSHITRADNCHLFDDQGKRYVDLESGVWCTAVGHSHPRIRGAITTQYDRIAHSGFGYSHAAVTAAAREVLSLLALDGGRCIFLCSGSEAVEYAVRAVQVVTPGKRLLTMADSYFGAYGSANRKSAEEWVLFDWLPCGDCLPSLRCGADCQRWAAIPFDEIGGFLFEPGSSGGLVRFPPEKLIHSIIAAVRSREGWVAVNEVTTGMGRTGTWFGHQHYDMTPDVVALGKGVGNGYPVSVAVLSPHLVESQAGHPVAYAQSHQNDPLGAAVVREVIAIIREEGLIARGCRMAERLSAGLERIRVRTGNIAAIRSRGLMMAVELEDRGTGFTTQVHRDLVRNGYLVGRRPGLNVFRIDPALTIEAADIDGFLTAFEAVLGGQGAGSSTFAEEAG